MDRRTALLNMCGSTGPAAASALRAQSAVFTCDYACTAHAQPEHTSSHPRQPPPTNHAHAAATWPGRHKACAQTYRDLRASHECYGPPALEAVEADVARGGMSGHAGTCGRPCSRAARCLP